MSLKTAQDISYAKDNLPFVVLEDGSQDEPTIFVQESPLEERSSEDEISVEIPEENLEVENSEDPLEIQIEFEGVLPGAPDSEEPMEVVEPVALEVVEEEKPEEDKNDARKSKKSEKWDWESKGADGFIIWIKERFDTVPKHSGQDTSGLQRAVAYLEKLDSEISKAMRLDLEGELDANKIEEVRSKIEEGIERLEERLNKINKIKKNKKKKSTGSSSENLIKEAQKITGVQGTFVTVPLLISAIGRICINGTVSAGHDINEIYKDQVKKYKLNDREKAEVKFFLFDMGYPLRGDRGFWNDDSQGVDESSSDNFDYSANYRS